MDKVYIGVDPGAGNRTGIATYNVTQQKWVAAGTRECHQDEAKQILTRFTRLSEVHACWGPETEETLLKLVASPDMAVVRLFHRVFKVFGVQDREYKLLAASTFHVLLGEVVNSLIPKLTHKGVPRRIVHANIEQFILRDPQISLTIRVEETSSNQQLFSRRMETLKGMLGQMTPDGLKRLHHEQTIALDMLAEQINKEVRKLNRVSNNVGMNGQISRDIQRHLTHVLYAPYEAVIPSGSPLNSEEMEALTGLVTKKSHAHIRSAASLISDVVSHDVATQFFGNITGNHPRAEQVKQVYAKGMINAQAKARRKREKGGW